MSDLERTLLGNTISLVAKASKANKEPESILEIASSSIVVMVAKQFQSSLDEKAIDEIRELHQIPHYVLLSFPSLEQTAYSFIGNKVYFCESIFECSL